jgi:hypothetical protein
MNRLAKAFALLAFAAISSPNAFAEDGNFRQDRAWHNGMETRFQVNRYSVNRIPERGQNYGTYCNGTFVDANLGRDGNPAFVGGYRSPFK